eukprot:GHVR01009566.1.p1 GENE.GHVR01009566.1~~GHVR01009566.1.p1  ORF type:complete len:119 (-),score=36.45 GHVR01009566.1:181-537(-)
MCVCVCVCVCVCHCLLDLPCLNRGDSPVCVYACVCVCVCVPVSVVFPVLFPIVRACVLLVVIFTPFTVRVWRDGRMETSRPVSANIACALFSSKEKSSSQLACVWAGLVRYFTGLLCT